jgi:geranylgeranyl diphosphate synthase type II
MTAGPALSEYLLVRRMEVDTALDAFLPSPPACPPVVCEAMRYSLLAGGKRLRPILCLAAAEAVASLASMSQAHARDQAMPAACALEMIHTYSLIHDDLPAMDDDALRRGRPTLHVVVGEGMAILAGDGLLTEAFALMTRHPGNDRPEIVERKLRVIGIVAAAAGATGMVGGQALDLESVAPRAIGTRSPFTADTLRNMHAMKTGALIEASAVAGATMGGGDAPAIAAIGECARQFGLAFQITDDILDVEGSSAALGKTPGKDAAAGKPTYPSVYGVDASRRLARECVDAAEAHLRTASLDAPHLIAIGRWMIERTT